jgi:hypothetical protein
MALLKSIAIIIGILVGSVFIWKFAAVYINVNGIEADLNQHAGDLLVECIGDPYCEDDIIEQMEMIRAHNNRDVILFYETLDYAASANTIMLDGYMNVDLFVHKYVHTFSITVDVWR